MALNALLLTLTVATSSALPADVVIETITRPSVPFVVGHLAIPRGDIPAAELLVLAALLNGPEMYDDGPVFNLRARGGIVRATATHAGLVVRLDGAPDDVESILAAAADVFVPRAITRQALSRAQGRILRERRAPKAPPDAMSARAFTAFSGRTPSHAPIVVDDIALHRLEPSALSMSQARLSSNRGKTLVLEGRVAPILVDAPVSAVASSTTFQPMPTPARLEDGAFGTDVALAFVVPTMFLDDDALRARLEAHLVVGCQPESVRVNVVNDGDIGVVVVRVPSAGRDPAVVGELLRARLLVIRNGLDRRQMLAVEERISIVGAGQESTFGEVGKKRATSSLTSSNVAPTVMKPDQAIRALMVPEVALLLHAPSTAP